MAAIRDWGGRLGKLFTVIVLCTFSHAQAASRCQSDLSTKRVQSLQGVEAKFSRLEKRAFIKDILDAKTVAQIAKDKDLPVYSARLEKVFDALLKNPRGDSLSIITSTLTSILRKEYVPRQMVVDGIKRAKKGDVASIYRMLGSLSFAETREIYFGPVSSSSLVSPASGSLVQRYIDETGAATKVMKMKSVANDGKRYDQNRLVVAVSEKSFPQFLKYFSGRTMFSVFGHANVFHAGQAYAYGGGKSNLRPLSQNTPLPMVILKPSEGERMYRYMELTAEPKYHGWGTALKIPWQLPNYTDAGAYQCCTHFIGNIPIGDKLVTEYFFPKRNEYNGYARNQNASRRKKLRAWSDPENEELKQVWTAPGHEQLSAVLGQIRANKAGEFASPGWVIETLMGPTTNERVPVIFIFVENHRTQIQADPEWHFEAPH